MENFTSSFLQHSITFFAIIDPIGVSAIMLSLLGNSATINSVNNVAKKVSITIVISFFIVIISGNFILQLFGINTNSLKVMGGIILILTALSMIQSKEPSKSNNTNSKIDFSIIPIAIPITFGPGIFSAIIVVRDQANSLLEIGAIVLAFLINALLVYFIFKNSIHIKSYLGNIGTQIVTKLMGLIVGAIAVQFIVQGSVELVRNYW